MGSRAGRRSDGGARGVAVVWLVHARRVDWLDLLDELEKRIEPLEKAVVEAADSHQQACLLMSHTGGGPIVSLVYVLTIGDWTRYARSRERPVIGSRLAEDSRADKRRLGHIASRAHAAALAAGPSRYGGTTVRSKPAPLYLRLSQMWHHGVAKLPIAHKLAVDVSDVALGAELQQVMERGSHAGQLVSPVAEA